MVGGAELVLDDHNIVRLNIATEQIEGELADLVLCSLQFQVEAKQVA